ncbi:MAG TPA: ABC transporter substrate-binding protein [Pirellulaceae bacterium]|jgi:putative ABC transport system substrate-binding protein
MPVVGFLNSLSPAETSHIVGAFRQGMAQAGLIERKTVRFDYLYADGVYERLPAMASEFVRRNVAVIAAGAPPAAIAAKAATSTIPIVFVVGFDPVTAGLVASYNRPGGNATGVCLITSPLAQKRLELIFELMPRARNFIMLVNPTFSEGPIEIRDAQAAASANGRQLHTVDAGTEAEIDKAFESIREQGGEALIVASDPFFVTQRAQLATLAARHSIPAIYPFREQVAAGGLMSYGPSLADAYRQAGLYSGRILKGEKAAELPVVQPTTFEMVINLKTARSLGIDVPARLQARADEVIE